MKRIILIIWSFLFLFGLCACSNSPVTKMDQWVMPDTAFPLGEISPYATGIIELSLRDASREDREIEIEIWYPAKTE